MQILIDTNSKTLTLKGKASLDELFTFLSDKIKDWPDWSLQAEENKYSFDHLWRTDSDTPFKISSGYFDAKNLFNSVTATPTVKYRGSTSDSK